jgi:hypothetical protein
MNAQYRPVLVEQWPPETMAWIRTGCIIAAIVIGSLGNAYFTVAIAKSQVRDAMRETFKDMPMAGVAR